MNKDLKASIFSWHDDSNSIKLRLIIVMCCFIFCFIILSYRLLSIIFSYHDKVKEYQTYFSDYRKEIVDCNNNLLAIDVPSFSLFANPQKVIEPKLSLKKLKSILPDIDSCKLLDQLLSKKSFIWIKRDLSPKQQEQIIDLGLPGFDFKNEKKRVYTFGNLLSHIIGYVGRDGIGLAGVEKYYDKFLQSGSTKSSSSNRNYNNYLQLSIDVRLQNILNDELEKTSQEFNAIGAVGIIANPENGEILAIVSKPDFDPHHPQKAKREQLFNMASLGVIEMGSVFKSITMAIGLDTKIVDVNDLYDISKMRVGNFQLKDLHPRRGWNSISEIFLYSSNIGMSQIALEIGKDHFYRYIKTLGILDQINIELPERGTPIFPLFNKWNDLTLVTMSYGYSISISPLHLIQAVIPMINGGYFKPLTIVKKSYSNSAEFRVFSEETSINMKKLFRLVVKEGTGKKADIIGYLVGGKTGTSEKLDGKHYVKNKRRASFISAFPIDKPKYIIYVMFDEPKGVKRTFGFATAGWVAAPTVGRVIERIIALYGMEPIKHNNYDEIIQDMLIKTGS